jgi:hypothetical protein
MMRPARQAKSCYRKVNEILTAGVGWIARSERDRAHTHVTAKERASIHRGRRVSGGG